MKDKDENTGPMESEEKVIIIPKEDAVFWMDKNGLWHNEHGKFEHPKIIRYFHESIQKDERGYHLRQTRDGFLEKVYFPHEDTALFVFDIREDAKNLTLILNTGKTMILDPGQLVTRDDSLYVQGPDHRIKFAQNALVKISRFLAPDRESLCLILGGVSYPIPEEPE
ncbi:hypothetical protein [Desulfospira joergensenii]|uniref:hypothetical protein n=1 Tax=Desulfospira joergensenii TaxID=53329 RepID=UPI0003B3928A|nr:hypothetical protein [Desulfospira joergensenii]